jgi:hypothetical protein
LEQAELVCKKMERVRLLVITCSGLAPLSRTKVRLWLRVIVYDLGTWWGKKMQFHGFVLWRFEGDKIAERWATVTQPAEGAEWTRS